MVAALLMKIKIRSYFELYYMCMYLYLDPIKISDIISYPHCTYMLHGFSPVCK